MPVARAANRVMRVLLIASVAVPLALYGGISWYLREQRLREGMTHVQQTVRVLEEHALRVFEAQQLIIDRVDQYIEGMSWEEIRSSRDVHEFLKEVADSSPHVDGLWLVPPDGRTANSADFFPFPDVDAADREYFKALRNKDELHFGEMIVGKTKGNLNFNLSERRSPRDSFNGLILVTASLDYFTSFWKEASDYPDHVAGLFRPDGEIMARFPPTKSVMGRLSADSPLLRAMRSGDDGVWISKSSIDGESRIYGYSRVGDYPVFIGFGVPVDDVLAPWRRDLLYNGLIALTAALLLGGVALLALRWHRQTALAMYSWRETAGALSREVARREKAEDVAAGRQRLLAELEQATSERKAILDSMIEGVTAYDAAGEVTYCNRASLGILRLPATSLPNFGAMAREGRMKLPDGSTVSAGDEPVRRLLRGETLEQEEYRLEFHGGPSAVCRFSGAPLRDADGCVTGGVLTFADVTEEKDEAERRSLLLSELDHRVRNMLATIVAMVRLTSDRAASKEALVKTLIGRIGAMARTHGLLTKTGWRGASLRQIIRDEVQPYATEGRVSLTGEDDVVLPPKDAVDFALVVHELATNAAKHGAWSGERGKVEIGWRIEDGARPAVSVSWRETGGPPVARPARTGFGSALMQSVFREENAGVDLELDPAGVVCRIRVPLRPGSVSREVSPLEQLPSERPPEGALSGLRVMLAEDEPVVQLDVCDVLERAGAIVIGPASSLHEARTLIETGGFDAALLDVNLNGENISPAAEILADRGVPVVFTTGYGEPDLLTPGLHALPRLQKPVAAGDVVAALLSATSRATAG